VVATQSLGHDSGLQPSGVGAATQQSLGAHCGSSVTLNDMLHDTQCAAAHGIRPMLGLCCASCHNARAHSSSSLRFVWQAATAPTPGPTCWPYTLPPATLFQLSSETASQSCTLLVLSMVLRAALNPVASNRGAATAQHSRRQPLERSNRLFIADASNPI